MSPRIDSFFAQPTWPVAVATLIAACLTVILQFFLNKRSRQFAEALQQHAAATAERNAETAAALAELKKIELAGNTVAKLTDHLVVHVERLHGEFAELLALLDVHRLAPSPEDSPESAARMLTLCRSISLAISPRGNFAEHLNDQLGHVRQALQTGQLLDDDWAGLIEALRYNAWKIIDAERDRIPESLIDGKMIERRELEPNRWVPGR